MRAGWDDATLVGELLGRAREADDAIAVVDLAGARTTRRGQLVADALALAGRFERAGLRAGDVASIQLPNRYETVVVAIAALRLGLIVNPLLPSYRVHELDFVFRKAAPRLVVTPDRYRGHDHAAMIAGLRGTLPADGLHLVVPCGEDDARPEAFLDSLRAEPPTRVDRPSASAPSELIFTSGTESTPKGILHSEQTTQAGVRAMRDALGLAAGDVVWMPSPVGHSTGFNFGLRLALSLGLPLVLQDRWDATTAIDLIRAQTGRVYTLAATTFLQDLVDALAKRREALPQLDRFCCGGAPVPPELVAAADTHGLRVLRLYGSTEALVVSCHRPGTPLAERMASDGAALPHVEIRLAEDGEVLVHSPQTALGYFGDPERTRETFGAGGWVRSGDLGRIDPSGALAIVGRKKEILIRGGLNIAPREIEESLLAFPEIERCAVIGLPDERLGERVCACVVLAPGASLELATAVERLRAAGLATYKLPQDWRVVDALPTTASGKVQKHRLRAMVVPGARR
ncbi:MAG: AMP-binding protein [Myxococcota bacterium]